MISGGPAVRACLRAGPLGARALMACWPEGDGGATGLPGPYSVPGTLMASAFSAPGSRVLETADVIFTAGDIGHARPGEWLSRTLSRYPGCEVAAIGNRYGECAVAARDGWFGILSLRGRRDPSVCAFAGAVFVFGWVTAQLPLSCIQPLRLVISGRDAFAMPARDKMGTSLLHFRFCYAGSSGALGAGDSCVPAISASSSRTDSASGAPSFA